jgi:ABC-type transport system substrate-binding protein
MGRRLGLSLTALCVGVSLLVSSAFAGRDDEAKRGGTLRLMWGAEPDYMDPAFAVGNRGSWTLLFATCAKLFNTVHDSDTGRSQVVPEVARGLPSVSENGRTYIFELKRTFRFHTGAPVDARTFAYTLNRTANLNQRSPAVRRGLLDEIIGLRAVKRGEAKTLSGVQVLDRYRLRIRLIRPAGDFVARLTAPWFCPIPPGTPLGPIQDAPPGSGRYYIAERAVNRRMVLERNPFYRGGRTANPDRIIWAIEPNATERIRATEEDRNDWTTLFNYRDEVVKALEKKYGINRPGGRLWRTPANMTFIFAFNHDRPAFKGVGQAPLKKAINYALDRQALTSAHGYRSVQPTDRLLPASLSESRRVYSLRGADPVTARKWLERARSRPTALTLYTANLPFSIASAEVFASNLKQLGIRVNVEYFDFELLLQKLRARGTQAQPWDIGWLIWGSFYDDPAGVFIPLLRDTRLGARVDGANGVTGAGRAKAWADLEAYLMRNDPPVAAYAHGMRIDLVSPSFGCYRSDAFYELDFAAACKLDRR